MPEMFGIRGIVGSILEACDLNGTLKWFWRFHEFRAEIHFAILRNHIPRFLTSWISMISAISYQKKRSSTIQENNSLLNVLNKIWKSSFVLILGISRMILLMFHQNNTRITRILDTQRCKSTFLGMSSILTDVLKFQSNFWKISYLSSPIWASLKEGSKKCCWIFQKPDHQIISNSVTSSNLESSSTWLEFWFHPSWNGHGQEMAIFLTSLWWTKWSRQVNHI